MKATHRTRARALVERFFNIYSDDAKEWTSWDQDSTSILCDVVDEFLWEEKPGWCSLHWNDAGPRAARPMKPHLESGLSDDGEESRFQWWRDSAVVSTFTCALRAGIDVVCEPSAGVVGYSVGDLRRMYPEGLPQWLVDAFAAEVPGAPTLLAARDNEAIWL